MRPLLAAALCAVLAAAAACVRSPAAPSDSGAEGGEQIVQGQAVSAVDGAASAGVQVKVGLGQPVVTDGSGAFRATVSGTGSHALLITGGNIVERRTAVNAGDNNTRVSLIPSSFDLRSFDEMFRTANARLQRWTTQPALVIVASVLTYHGPADDYVASAEQMTAVEVSQMRTDLVDALTLLTGGVYTSFSSAVVERPADGQSVSVTRSGKIVVARYSGIETLAGTIGYGRWAEDAAGNVGAGAMFLDWVFDREDERRRRLRFHELGHALGYNHVESRPSIMNPAIGPEPTAFDRSAAMVAFQRPPGNVSPDTDPSYGSTPRGFGGGSLRWNIRYCAAMAARPPRSTNF